MSIMRRRLLLKKVHAGRNRAPCHCTPPPQFDAVSPGGAWGTEESIIPSDANGSCIGLCSPLPLQPRHATEPRQATSALVDTSNHLPFQGNKNHPNWQCLDTDPYWRFQNCHGQAHPSVLHWLPCGGAHHPEAKPKAGLLSRSVPGSDISCMYRDWHTRKPKSSGYAASRVGGRRRAKQR
jgi:hypothetical protein